MANCTGNGLAIGVLVTSLFLTTVRKNTTTPLDFSFCVLMRCLPQPSPTSHDTRPIVRLNLD